MHSFFLYWTMVVFGVGVIAITGLLFMFARSCYATYLEMRINNLNRIAPRLWVWRACRAYRKVSPLPKENGVVYSTRETLMRSLNKIIELAEEEGYTVSIDAVPNHPLRMGNYRMVPSVHEGVDMYRDRLPHSEE